MQSQLLLTIVLAAASADTVADSQHRMFDAGLDNQAGLTFTPDGAAAYWVEWDGEWGSNAVSRRTIYVSTLDNGEWSPAEPAPFSGEYSDDDPFVSPDGQWLYFVSERPGDDDELDADIWRYQLTGDERLQLLNINSDSAEYSPVVTTSGTLYFASAREGGYGQGDLYRAAVKGGKFAEPENLGRAVNSSTGEWNLWVSASEYDLVFEASSRPTNVSVPGDLYYSWRTPAGWTAAVPLASLNARGSELLPRLHPDGETLYFTTARSGGHASIVAADWQSLRAEARSQYAPVLLVANRSSHDVSFVDLARGEVIAPVGAGEGPHLLSNVSGGRVLATGYGEFPQPHGRPVESRPPFVESLNSRMTLIDVATQSALLDTVVEDCSKPHASWIVAQNAYITCEAEQRIAVVDLNSGRTTGHFDTQQQGSHVLAFEPESRTLSVSNTDSGSVTLMNIDSGNTRVVPLAAGSEGSLAIDGQIWVANATDGSVSIVDPSNASVVRQLEAVCNFPIAFGAEQSNEVWLACFASRELVSIDRTSCEVVRRIKLSEPPLNIITHPGRRLAYVSLPRQNAVAEIDLETGEELRRIRVGIEPDGLRWGTAELIVLELGRRGDAAAVVP